MIDNSRYPMSALYLTYEVQVRALCAIALCLAPLAFSPGCGPTQVTCAGTGVTSPTAAVSINLGDLLKPEASATLHVGDELYVGSNGCGDYGLPPSKSLALTLVEVSRHQQTGPGTGDGTDTLDVTYRAAAPGRVVISITCHSDFCDGAPIGVTATVIASP
jgi:hypothetical protein